MAWMDGGWRYLFLLARRLWRPTAGAIAAGMAWQGAAIAAPLLIKRAIDTGIVHHHTRALWWACAGVVALGAVEAVAGGSRHFFAIRNRARSDAQVRDAIFRRALELDARYHDRVGAGDLISRASNDAELVSRAFDSIGHTVGYVLTLIGAAAILLAIDWPLALAVLAALPLVSVGFGRYSKRYAERTKINQEALADATTLVEETVAGIRVVKGLNAGAALAERFRRQSDDVVRTALDVARVDAVFLPALEALPLVGILVVLWYGSHRVLNGSITIGTFAVFNFYLALLVNPLRTVGPDGPRTSLVAPDSLDVDLGRDTCVLLYRVVREAVRNAVKHAHATAIQVTLRVEDDSIAVEVADDGVGFVGAAPEGHFGLRLLADTVRDAGGELTIDSSPGAGVRLRVRLPIA